MISYLTATNPVASFLSGAGQQGQGHVSVPDGVFHRDLPRVDSPG